MTDTQPLGVHKVRSLVKLSLSLHSRGNTNGLPRDIDCRAWELAKTVERRLREFCLTRQDLTYALEEAEIRPAYVATLALVNMSAVHSFVDLHRLFGLDDSMKLSTFEARGIASDVQVVDEQIIKDLAAKYGRNPTKIKPGASREELASWLSHSGCYELFRVVAIKIGLGFEELPESLYGQSMESILIGYRQRNEDGYFAPKAQEFIYSMNVQPDERDVYLSGKLPEAHLKRKAMRQAVRQFLQDFFALNKSMVV